MWCVGVCVTIGRGCERHADLIMHTHTHTTVSSSHRYIDRCLQTGEQAKTNCGSRLQFVVASHRWHHPRLPILLFIFYLHTSKQHASFVGFATIWFFIYFSLSSAPVAVAADAYPMYCRCRRTQNNTAHISTHTHTAPKMKHSAFLCDSFRVHTVQWVHIYTARKSSWQTERLQNRQCALHSAAMGGGYVGSRTRYPIPFITHTHTHTPAHNERRNRVIIYDSLLFRVFLLLIFVCCTCLCVYARVVFFALIVGVVVVVSSALLWHLHTYT